MGPWVGLYSGNRQLISDFNLLRSYQDMTKLGSVTDEFNNPFLSQATGPHLTGIPFWLLMGIV
jgi:hypothetical protein